MNTQLTQEDKSRVFAMYLGAYCRTETEDNLYVSDVGYRKDIEMGMLTVVSIDDEGEGWNVYNHFDEHKLILKDLSDITDEDALHIANLATNTASDKLTSQKKILYRSDNGIIIQVAGLKVLIVHQRTFEVGVYSSTEDEKYFWNSNQVEIIDYLRSKCYALPYKGVNLFDAGIAIRKTKTITQ